MSRIQRLIDARPADADVPETKRVRSRPAVEQILAAVADHFGYGEPPWTSGRRSDDASRAAAAYLARGRFGCPTKLVAAALGCRDASGVSHAIKRIDAGTPALLETLRRLERGST